MCLSGFGRGELPMTVSRPVLPLSILLLFVALPARANFGSYPGGWTSAPTGLENIRIAREALTVDLRACDGSELADVSQERRQPVGKVEAIYELNNQGPPKDVRLIFAAGTNIGEDAQVQHDSQLVPVQWARGNAWRRLTPTQSPGFDGGPARRFEGADGEGSFSVSLRVPAGSSTLRVAFRTLIGNDRSLMPTCCWQFVYLLAPARDWGGFDKLDVRVLVPPGWQAVCNLELERDGDVLIGSFDQMPADALTLSIRMPPEPFREPIEQRQRVLWFAACGLALLLLIATWRFGGRTGRFKRKSSLSAARSGVSRRGCSHTHRSACPPIPRPCRRCSGARPAPASR